MRFGTAGTTRFCEKRRYKIQKIRVNWVQKIELPSHLENDNWGFPNIES